MTTFRYMVNKVETSIEFYTKYFGFSLAENWAAFRDEIISKPGRKQTLAEDPLGNPIEIFQAA